MCLHSITKKDPDTYLTIRFQVGVIDPAPDSLWPNNYGTWVDEFDVLGLRDCLSHVWEKVDIIYCDSWPVQTLNRPYGQVDRQKLKSLLLGTCASNGVRFLVGKVSSVEYGDEYATVNCADGTRCVVSLPQNSVFQWWGSENRIQIYKNTIGLRLGWPT